MNMIITPPDRESGRLEAEPPIHVPGGGALRRVAVALLDVSQEFQRFQASTAGQMGRRLGCEVELLFAGQSARVQEAQLRELLGRPSLERPELIVAQPVGGDRLERVAREAVQHGIGWILLNPGVQYVGALREECPALPIAAVSGDQREIGRLQGRQLLAGLGPVQGAVLYVTGVSHTSAAQGRLDGAREILSPHGIALEVIEGDWTEAGAFRAAAKWMRSRRAWWRRCTGGDTRLPAAVLCQNDHMALGTRRALREYVDGGSALPPTFGVDGLPEGGQRLVELGELCATVIVPANAGPAIHLAVNMVRTGSWLPAEVLMSPLSHPRLDDLYRLRGATAPWLSDLE